MKKSAIFSSFLLCFQLSAQVGIGTNTPDNSAMLEVQSSSKGLLTPRMTKAQRDNITTPQTGLLIYQTDALAGFYLYSGATWTRLAQESFGDIKSGVQNADHSGWVLLDGRALSSLSASQLAAATSLGFSGNLPNANNAYLVQNGGTVGAVSGSNTTTLTQANLPNVSFTGTASSAGAHTHTVDPVSTSSSSDGSHAHTTDPGAVYTSTDGNHAHSIGRRLNEDNGAYDPGNGHASENSAATTDRTFSNYFSTSTNGNHAHTVDIPSTTSSTNGQHAHTVDIPSTTSTSDGNHTHPVSVASGGIATPINIAPKSLTVNMFIYLGL
jgi:hypothetical protein